jgi:hypothetical protein
MRLAFVVGLSLATFAFGSASGQEPAAGAPAEAQPKQAPSKSEGPKLNSGEPYEGVAPGGANLPPRAPKLPLHHGPQRLTWTGFQVRDGVPTVFLEVTGAPDYRVEAEKGAVIITLKNTVVPLRNNRRPLRVGAFNTPVESVETKVHGKDTRITIHTNDAGPPEHHERIEPAAGGFQMLLVALPK